MTNKHDGPRGAEPTRLTEAEAEELFLLIENARKAHYKFADAQAEHRSQSSEYRTAQEAVIEASAALYRWQRDHGLTEEAWRRLK
jgi:hypothetical protein